MAGHIEATWERWYTRFDAVIENKVGNVSNVFNRLVLIYGNNKIMRYSIMELPFL